MGYQKGDFIIHFAGIDINELTHLFQVYGERVVDNTDCITLDSYLNIYGFNLSPQHSLNNEGYMTPLQKKQFEKRLRSLRNVQSIAEIGLNGGHSLMHFFNCCKTLKRTLSFDINQHSYTKYAVEFFSRFYKDRFTFVEGDSGKTVPAYVKNSNEKYDLIYIDGCHTYEHCLNDIINCRGLAHRKTLLWIDDYHGPTINAAVTECINRGIIKLVKIHYAPDPYIGDRCWVEARYLN